jgi:hypothetical protein
MNQQYIDFLKTKRKYELNSFLKFKKKKKGKPSCVFCKRAVGMNFEIKNNGTVYIAKCGDSKNPCNQKINTRIPKYVILQKRMNELNKELDSLIAELKNFRVRVIYTDVIEKEDIERFEYLKNEIAKSVQELTILKNKIQEYPSKVEDVDIIPPIKPGDYDSYNEHMNKYKNNTRKLESFLLYDYPEKAGITKEGMSFPSESDNIGNVHMEHPLLVSQNSLQIVEDESLNTK